MNPYKAPAQETCQAILETPATISRWAFWLRILMTLVVALLLYATLAFSSLVITNLLAGPYIPDSTPTARHLYWWRTGNTITTIVRYTVVGLTAYSITLQVWRAIRTAN